MNIDKKSILKCIIVAIFMTFIFVLIKLYDAKKAQESLDWKQHSLYFSGIFIFYYCVDQFSKKRNSIK